MRFLKGYIAQVAVWAVVLTFIASPFLGLLATGPATAAGPDGPASSRMGKGVLYKVPEPRSRTLRGVDWKPGTDQAFIVGQGAIYLYNATVKTLTQLDGSESTDHYYEDIAWRPQGDYAIIVGTTPITTRAFGLVSKMWLDGATWRISVIKQDYQYRLTDVAWAPDGSYAVIVGGAIGGVDEGVGTALLRLTHPDNNLDVVWADPGPSGLSSVSYNQALGRFYAVGLNGRMMTYDGAQYKDISDPALKNAEMFGISWRDNGGRGMVAAWFSGTLKGYIITTDGTYNRIVYEDPNMGYLNDASWAPRSDYTLLVGQSGGIYEYSVQNAKPAKVNSVDSKHYYGVDFNANGTSAIIVGSDGDILRYDVSYPAKQNFPPAVYIASPHDNDAFDYGKTIVFSSNSTHDDDLDPLTYKWSSSFDGILSNQPYFSKTLTTGRHTITLEVNDNEGHTSKAYINVTVRPPKDAPKIDAGPNKIGYVGVDVTLDGKVVKSDFDIKSYEWDCMGDGQWRTTDKAPTTCRYGEVGKYNATLKVTDVRLAVATDTVVVSVFPKLSDADKLVNVTSKSPLHPGEYLIFYVNSSVSKSVELYVVDPKDTEYQEGPTPMPNGTNYLTMIIPKNFKTGLYDIKWRYHDQNDSKTDWYVSHDRFEVKKYKTDGTSNLFMMIAAATVVIVLVVVAIVVVVMYMLKRSVMKLEAAVLFYRDGRVVHSYVPPSAQPPQTATPPPTPPAAPPPAQEQYGSQQAYGTATPSPTVQAPQYTAQPAPQYTPQPTVPDQYQPQPAYPPQSTMQPQGPPSIQAPGQYTPQPAYPPQPTIQPQGPPSVQAPGQYQPQPAYAPQPVAPPQPAYAPQPETPAPSTAPSDPTNIGLDRAKAVVKEAIEGIRQGTTSRLPDKIIEGMRTILVEQGQHTIMAVSITGPEPQDLKKGMKNALQEIEILYGNQLRNWDGLTQDMPKIQAIIEKEVKKRQ